MMKSKFIRILACSFIVCLLIPAIIHSTKQGSETYRHNPFIKLPPAITIGPESSPYVLKQGERDKLSLVIDDLSLPEQPVRKDHAMITNTGEYTGLTEAELMKLKQVHRVKTSPRPGTGKEPISTIEAAPRAAGAAGLTDSEKTKLEAWKKARLKTPQAGHNQ